MADPNSNLPYDDSFDDYLVDYLSFITDPNSPSLPILSPINEPQPVLSLIPHVPNDQYENITNVNHNTNIAADPGGFFNDPMLWDSFNQFNSNNSNEAGPSQSRGQNSKRTYEEFLNDATPLPVWPPPPVPSRCSYCQVLREIIHTDGNSTTKLEIHGRMGMICHAILENRDHVNMVLSDPQYHLVDFCSRSIRNVKRFLRKYCEEKKNAGYLMVQDPLSIFYEALCVGLEWVDNLSNDDSFNPSPTNSGVERQADQTEVEAEVERMPRTNLAQQRERTGKLTLKDFEDYFHLPIEEASRRMNLCPTVVKKICRKHGMSRWPHRKVKSIQRQLSLLREVLNSSVDPVVRANTQREIQKLDEELANIYSGATS